MLISVNNKFKQGTPFKLMIEVGLLISFKLMIEVELLISFKLMIEVAVLMPLKSTIEAERPIILE